MARGLRRLGTSPGKMMEVVSPHGVTTAQASLFIVASNRLIQEALARLFRKRPEFVLSGAYPYSPEVLRRIVAVSPHILLFEPPTKSLPELDFIRQARRVAGMEVLLVGMKEDRNTFFAAIRAGATGYVLEEATAGDIVAAAQALLRGETVSPPRLCRALFDYLAESGPTPFGFAGEPRLDLTRRQRQLARLIAKGLTNKEIAAQLNLSEQTVKNHIHNMLGKAHADERSDLVRLADRQGLLS